MKKIDSDSAEYKKKAISIAFDFAPQIYPCAKCGHPVASGYCCSGCGTGSPRDEFDE